jgi:hypothetical protein
MHALTELWDGCSGFNRLNREPSEFRAAANVKLRNSNDFSTLTQCKKSIR